MSRGIQIPLKRKTKDDTVQRLRAADPKDFKSLRSRILKFVLENKVLCQKVGRDFRKSSVIGSKTTGSHCLQLRTALVRSGIAGHARLRCKTARKQHQSSPF